MKVRRSFRLQLALRFGLTMAGGTAAVALIGYLALRTTLDRQIDASLVAVASIQAASVTDDPSGTMRFFEWDLNEAEIESLGGLNRFAQIWSEDGESLNRSRQLTADLPLDREALLLAADGELVWRRADWQSHFLRSLYYPLARLGESHAEHILQVAAPLDWRDRTLRSGATFLIALTLVFSTASFAGSWWLADRAVRAVGEIATQAEAIGAETLGRRITAHGETSEYERLVGVLNTMLERLDAAFDAQRRFTADASHELRSPLTALRGELELARRRDREPEEYRRVIDSALEEATRLTRLVEDLLTLARSDAGAMHVRRVEVDVAERVRVATERLRRRADERQVRLEIEAGDATVAAADPELIDRLVWNLVDNAVKFCRPEGRVTVSVSGLGDSLELRVADEGPGLPAGSPEALFDRFSRADVERASEGTGLGLAIVRAISEAHGGGVVARDGPSGGAEFVVSLPRV
jgi:two-component system OmpR family sensor kinase